MINLITVKEPKIKFFDFRAFQINGQMPSHDKIIFHMVFGAYYITTRNCQLWLVYFKAYERKELENSLSKTSIDSIETEYSEVTLNNDLSAVNPGKFHFMSYRMSLVSLKIGCLVIEWDIWISKVSWSETLLEIKREKMTLPEYDPNLFGQSWTELSFIFLDSGNKREKKILRIGW